MNCHDFRELASHLDSADATDERSVAHVRDCADCRGFLQQRQTLAAGLLALRNRTASLEAGAGVEREVLLAFRQSRERQTAEARPQPRILRFPALSGWQRPAFAAAAAALAVGLGLGIWFWQHSVDSAQQVANQPAVQQTIPDVHQPTAPQEEAARTSPQPSQARAVADVHASTKALKAPSPQPANQSLTQVAQAQEYVPLMLCDPLSCAGDEQVVRMEIPASSVDASNGSAETLLADVVVGDDGLVRAIRIVQQ